MTGDFNLLADLLPQPMLLVDGAGAIAAVNQAACKLLGRPAEQLLAAPLARFCQTGAPALAEMIRSSARSTSVAPGSLTLLLADGSTVACRCEGALYRRRSEVAPAVVLLRLSLRREAVHQFSLLNQRIDDLSREVALRRSIEAQLLATTERLQQADRRKDEFLSMLAHELRNPLAPLRMGVQLLERTHGALPEVARLTGMLARQTDHMTRLVDDLLDVARLTRGSIDMRQDRMALADVLVQAVEMSRPGLEARGLELVLELPPAELNVVGDLTRLVQVFTNLLTNATKFTEPGGRVTLTARRDDADAVVTVRDTGMGIAPELLPQVFDLFVQGERSLDRTQGGLGVGLTIVRSIVQQHGGSVRASSVGRGHGSAFELRLPLPIHAAPVTRAGPGAAAESSGAVPRKVLVVDDNVDAAQTLCAILESWGHEAQCVYSPRDALERIAGFQPDTLLLDIGLPGMNGYELARAVRQLPQAEAMLLVAITGYGDAEARRLSAAAGYDWHLTKPVDPDTLEQLLATRHRSCGAQPE